MKHRLLIVLAAAAACLAALTGCEKKPLTERQILELIYKTAGGATAWDESYQTSWCTDAPLNEWEGVTADQEDHVTALRIRDCVGAIPAEISGLTGLTELNLGVNNRDLEAAPENPIPASLAELTGLQRLYLYVYGPAASLPDLTGLTGLETISLGIPDEMPFPEVPAQITSLDISGGCGEIPESYYSLENLQRLCITTSGLKAALSPKVAQLKNLKHLQVDQTAGFIGSVDSPEGEFPQEIFSMTGLTNIFLRQICSSGSLPETIGDMQNLRSMTICRCGLTGGIPASITRLTKISRLSIYDNPDLGGEIPANIGDMAALRDLDFARDGLTGTIPASIGNLANLEGLQLQKNHLTGKIPAELAKCTNLGKGVFIDFSGLR